MVSVALEGVGHDCLERGLDLERRRAGGKRGAIADAEDMCVHRHGGLTEGHVEHHIRGLAADARQGFKLLAEHGGVVPPSREALETLPGVGRKTANVVLNIAFGEPTIAVDTHIFRIGNRTGLAPGKTPFEVETALEAAVPDAYKRHAHHWLILHGRYICLARKPLCEKCIIADLCRWPGKTVAA